MADEKIAVYFCHCGTNIAGTVDVEKVTALGRRAARTSRSPASTSTCAPTRARS